MNPETQMPDPVERLATRLALTAHAHRAGYQQALAEALSLTQDPEWRDRVLKLMQQAAREVERFGEALRVAVEAIERVELQTNTPTRLAVELPQGSDVIEAVRHVRLTEGMRERLEQLSADVAFGARPAPCVASQEFLSEKRRGGRRRRGRGRRR